MLTPDVAQAIDEVRAAFPGRAIQVEEDGQGGVYVTVPDLELGQQYAPACSWIGFQISFQYPLAQVYPHYTDAALARADGQGHGQGFATTSWRDRQVLQLSRTSREWDPALDTAATKLAQVLRWLRQQ